MRNIADAFTRIVLQKWSGSTGCCLFKDASLWLKWDYECCFYDVETSRKKTNKKPTNAYAIYKMSRPLHRIYSRKHIYQN